MKDKKENPPAFPFDTRNKYTGRVDGQEKGMDLRDYFAAKALQALMTNQRNFDYVPGGKDRKKVLKSLVEDSYAVADEMLNERNK